MAFYCQNLLLGALSSRSAPSLLVGELFKEFGIFLNTGVYADCNGECLRIHVTPNYAKIKILETFPGAKYTQQKVHTLRIKNEIKFL
jgi:hypothetical protein